MKIEWKNSSRAFNGKMIQEGRTKARTKDGEYFRFYIKPICYNGDIIYKLETGCGVTGLIASSYSKDSLKEIAQRINDGEQELKYII